MSEQIAREYLIKKCKKYEDKIYDAEIRLTVLKGFNIALSVCFYILAVLSLVSFIGNKSPKDIDPEFLISSFFVIQLGLAIVFYALHITIIRYVVFGKQYRIKKYYEKKI